MPKIYSQVVDQCTLNTQLNKIGLFAERDAVSEFWIVRDKAGNKWVYTDSEVWPMMHARISARSEMDYFNGELESQDKPETGVKGYK